MSEKHELSILFCNSQMISDPVVLEIGPVKNSCPFCDYFVPEYIKELPLDEFDFLGANEDSGIWVCHFEVVIETTQISNGYYEPPDHHTEHYFIGPSFEKYDPIAHGFFHKEPDCSCPKAQETNELPPF